MNNVAHDKLIIKQLLSRRNDLHGRLERIDDQDVFSQIEVTAYIDEINKTLSFIKELKDNGQRSHKDKILGRK